MNQPRLPLANPRCHTPPPHPKNIVCCHLPSPLAFAVVQYTAALRKPAPPAGSTPLNILSWNVAGLRALLKKVGGAGAGRTLPP